MTLTVLVADDHPMYRGGIRAALDDVDDIEVVGEATDGDQAVDAAQSLRPDVVLMDLHMPGTNGIEATRRLVNEVPGVGVLVLTMFDDEESLFAAVRAGLADIWSRVPPRNRSSGPSGPSPVERWSSVRAWPNE
jgi:DNA-binding NarL/FixJ family response regulator